MKCLRCASDMFSHGKRDFRLGNNGSLLGDMPLDAEGSLLLEVYSCPKCRKVEFFLPEEEPLEVDETFDGGLSTVICPDCGAEHDLDYPKCPNCGHRYEQ